MRRLVLAIVAVLVLAAAVGGYALVHRHDGTSGLPAASGCVHYPLTVAQAERRIARVRRIWLADLRRIPHETRSVMFGNVHSAPRERRSLRAQLHRLNTPEGLAAMRYPMSSLGLPRDAC